MSDNKHIILRPPTCRDCVVVCKEKKCIRCGVMKDMQATTKAQERDMWEHCPLEWDSPKK